MKDAKKMTILKVLIPILIISGCFLIQRIFTSREGKDNKKTVVVCRDSSKLAIVDDKPLEVISNKRYGELTGLKENFGFTSNNEVIVGVNNSEDTKNWNLCKLNISTLEIKHLNIPTINLISSEISTLKKIAYANDNKLHIYDLKKDSDIIIGDYIDKKTGLFSSTGGKWSEDGKNLITRAHFFKSMEDEYTIYDVEKSTRKVFKNKSLNGYGFMDSGCYIDSENYYFLGNKENKNNKVQRRDGLFKINSKSCKLDEIFNLAYVDTSKNSSWENSIANNASLSVLENGKKILFDGTIDGKAGVYFYNTNDNKFYNAISSIKFKEGIHGTPFWVSPDKTKVIYLYGVTENNKERWDLYAAKITGNTFSSKICIGKDINFAYNNMKWSDDSKSILYFTSKDKTDKQEINLITFK